MYNPEEPATGPPFGLTLASPINPLLLQSNGSYPSSTPNGHYLWGDTFISRQSPTHPLHPLPPNTMSGAIYPTDPHFPPISTEVPNATHINTPSFPTSSLSTSSVQAIPQPQFRAAYEPPVFKTFQERKRERERDRELALHARASGGIASSSPASNSLSRNTPSVSPFTPPSATLAMMGVSSGARPTPPPRTSATQLSSRAQSPSPLMQAHSGNISSTPMTIMQPPLEARTPSHVSTGTASSSSSTRPLPHPGRTIPRLQEPTTPMPYHHSSSPAAPSVVHSNSSAILERSDTISSVKSLDRPGFSSNTGRPLPKPPVVVATSRSLDRGSPAATTSPNIAQQKFVNGRKQPSTVLEVDDDLVSSMADLAFDVPNEVVRVNPTVTAPLVVVSPTVPVFSPVFDFDEAKMDSKAPAKYAPLPVVNVTVSPDTSEDEDEAGFVFSGLPTIAVSSSDTRDATEVSSISEPVPVITDSAFAPNHLRSVETAQVHPTRLETNSAILCTGCGDPIIGRIVSAMKQRWHPQCFTCGVCGELLEHVSSYEHEGRPYCHLDYHDRFAHRCHHCKTPIVDARFITLDDPVLGQRFYHELHFFCSECGDPFLDPSQSSAPGTEFQPGRKDTVIDEDGETNAFVIQKGHPYCERCHLRLHKPKCKGCMKPIPNVAVSAMGSKWHAECFVCGNCHQTFANNLFFPKGKIAFCTSCYDELAN